MSEITRRELYLAKIAGDDVSLPEYPITREEQYLARIAEGGGGQPVDAYTKSETDALLAIKAPAGQNYVETLNGTRIYVGSATPTGTIPTGSVWIGG